MNKKDKQLYLYLFVMHGKAIFRLKPFDEKRKNFPKGAKMVNACIPLDKNLIGERTVSFEHKGKTHTKKYKTFVDNTNLVEDIIRHMYNEIKKAEKRK